VTYSNQAKQSPFLDTQETLLGLIAVSHQPAQEHDRSARHVRQAMGNKAACTRLGDGYGLLLFGEQADDDGFQPVILAAEDEVTQKLPNDLLRTSDSAFGARAGCGQPHIDFADASAITDFESYSGQVLQSLGNFFLNQGFSEAGGFQRATGKRRGQRKFLFEQ